MKKFKQQLQQKINKPCILSCFDSIDSSNDFLANQADTDLIHICVTNKQTHGKGQHGRVWQSNHDSLLFSIKHQLKDCAISGLSLMVGISITKALQKFSTKSLMVKWPNDIYVDGAKLGGILIENQNQNQQHKIIIGVGINIKLPARFNLDDLAIDWHSVQNKPLTKLTLLALLINQILADLDLFATQGIIPFFTDWHRVNYLNQANITLNNHQTYQVVGIDLDGALLLKSTQNKIKKIYHSNQITGIKLDN